MPYSRPLQLKVADREDFAGFISGLFILTMVSALLSFQTIPLILLTILFFGAAWFLFILEIPKISKLKLISVIFPDGLVSIKLNDEIKIEGFLIGQQWCTHHVAVLRFKTEDGIKRVVLLSRQQNAHDYRRLKVCLRQDFYNDANNTLRQV